jgi:WD40 repeat protein/tRNA A-37 threonylcarbamoyl transferase component Bud32
MLDIRERFLLKGLLDEVEDAWERGTEISLKEMLSGIEPRLRERFLKEALLLQWDLQEVTQIDKAEFLERFPQYSKAVEEAFETFLARETSSAVTGDTGIGQTKTISQGMQDGGSGGPGIHSLVMGKYKLLEELGSGGMGVVYLAEDVTSGNRVAVKVLELQRLRRLPNRQAVLERFSQEYAGATKVSHPNLVELYEQQFEGDNPSYAMQYINGRSLAEIMRDRQLPLSNQLSATYLRDVAQAVAALHGAGVLHRDLTPANILVERQSNRPIVVDFGLAKIERGESRVTQSQDVFGTASYMSPEQATDASRVSEAADIYSLGATLYHLLAGHPPFQGADDEQTVKLVRSGYPLSPRDSNPAIDRDLETICMRCLEKNPKQRYASAADLADDLDRYLKKQPIRAKHVSRLRHWTRRNPTEAGLVILLFATLLTATILSSWLGTEAYFSGQVAQKNAEAAQTAKNEADQEAIRASKAEDKAIQSANKANKERIQAESRLAQLYMVTADQLRRSEQWEDSARSFAAGIEISEQLDKSSYLAWLGLAALYRQAPAPLNEISSPIPSPRRMVVTPNGRTVIVSSLGKEFAALDLATGRVLRTYRGHKDSVLDIAISRDGESLLTGSADGTVRVWDSNTAESRIIGKHSQAVSAVNFSKGGRYVISGDGNFGRGFNAARKGTVMIWDLTPDADEPEPIATLSGHSSTVTSVDLSADGKQALSAGDDATVRVWDVDRGEAIKTFSFHNSPVRRVAYNPDERAAISVGMNGSVRVTHIESGQPMAQATFKDQRAGLNSLSNAVLSADGRQVAIGGSNTTVPLLDITTGEVVREFTGHKAQAHGLGMGPEELLLTASTGNVKVWTRGSEPILKSLTRFSDGDQRWAASENGRWLLSGGQDRVARLWDVATRHTVLQVDNGHPEPISAVAVNRDGKQGATASGKLVQLLDLRNGNLVKSLSLKELPSGCLAFSPNDRWLAIANRQGGVELVDLESLQPQTLAPEQDQQESLVAEFARRAQQLLFTPDGKSLLLITEGVVSVWNLDSLELSQTWEIDLTPENPDSSSFVAALSPDGSELLVAEKPFQATAGVLGLLDVKTGKVVKHQPLSLETVERVLAVAFSPSGSLITFTSQGRLRVIDRNQGLLLHSSNIDIFRGTEAHIFDNGLKILMQSSAGTLLFDAALAETIYRVSSLQKAAATNIATKEAVPTQLILQARWFAARRRFDWAIQFLEEAADKGDGDPLLLARCYWQRGHSGDVALAGIAFDKAIDKEESPESIDYLTRCKAALTPHPSWSDVKNYEVSSVVATGNYVLSATNEPVILAGGSRSGTRWKFDDWKTVETSSVDVGGDGFLAISPNGERVAVNVGNREVQVWNVAATNALPQRAFSVPGLKTGLFAEDNLTFIVADSMGGLSSYDTDPESTQGKIAVGTAPPEAREACLEASPELKERLSRLPIALPLPQTVGAWQLLPEENVAIVGCHCAGSLNNPGYLYFWDTKTGKATPGQVVHTGGVTAMSLSTSKADDEAEAESRHVLATAGYEGKILLWNLKDQTLSERKTLASGLPVINQLDFSPDHQHLLVGLADGRIQIYDVASQELLWEKSAHFSAVEHLRWRPDGKGFSSAGAERRVLLWLLPPDINANN